MPDSSVWNRTPSTAEGTPSAGDDRAWFEEVFRAHYAALCTYVERLVGTPSEAEDVIQDLFVAVWERRVEWRARGAALAPVLYISARNRALNVLKRRRIQDRSQVVLGRDECAPGGSDEEVRWGEMKSAIDRAVDALPEQCRLIFRLSRQDRMTYGQIARALEISVKTVETQMGRALKSLRTSLATHLAASLALLITRLFG